VAYHPAHEKARREIVVKDLRITYLEAKVEELEHLLERRSNEIRLIQKHLDSAGLLVVSRVLSGLPPLPRPAHDLERWQDTTALIAADVEETMNDLWLSLKPLEGPDE